MDRRRFLQAGGALVAGGLLADLDFFESAASAAARSQARPNIVFILVDEMRFPTEFPAGVRSPAQFLHRFMPNLYELWRHGVKFESYYSAGNACSPARATLATGLYPHQEWLLATRTAAGPALQPNFPTYGKLLQAFGYQTPYIGKWHLSNPPSHGVRGYLNNYGFQGFTNPDPTGTNGQGEMEDGHIAQQAVRWLQANRRSDVPFCLTVSFVNPHDKQFFWAGSEGDHYEKLFEGSDVKPFITGYKSVPGEDNPPPHGYPELPSNWESRQQLTDHRKPPSQQLFRSFQEVVWGGAPDDPAVRRFSVQPSQIEPRQLGVGQAPFHYWQRGLDMYTLVQRMVDVQIGKVLAGVPESQRANTVFVFASDHGEYAGAHGLLSGKVGTAYEEAIHVPLIVADPSGRFAKQPDKPRRQLTSSVDLAPMLVTLGNRGSRRWHRGKYAEIYGERLDLVGLLRDPSAPGRDHVVFATDEIVPAAMNYLRAPTHVLAVRTREVKLVTYTRWARGTTRPIKASLKVEFYDYATPRGRAETESRPDDPRVKPLLDKLFHQYVPQEMEQPLTPALRPTVARARASYLVFQAASDAYSFKALVPQQQLRTKLGYGGNF